MMNNKLVSLVLFVLLLAAPLGSFSVSADLSDDYLDDFDDDYLDDFDDDYLDDLDDDYLDDLDDDYLDNLDDDFIDNLDDVVDIVDNIPDVPIPDDLPQPIPQPDPQPQPQAPTANAGPDQTLSCNAVVIFDGSQSVDPDGSINSFVWDFGDGSTGAGQNPQHSYSSLGTFGVTLTVTDNTGRTGADTLLVTIGNTAPTAVAGPDQSGGRSTTFSFDGSASSPACGQTLNHVWSFGDGTGASGTTATHSYTNIGTFIVTLTVTDAQGAMATDTLTVTVTNLPPTAIATADVLTPASNQQVTFDGSQSFDADGTIVSHAWDFETDGVIDAIGQTVSHIYNAVGNFIATLTVTDNDGATGSTTLNIGTIQPNNPPTIVSTPITVGVISQAYAYPVAAVDPDSDPLTFSLITFPTGMTIDFLSGLISWTPTVTQEGNHVVTLRVDDGRGGFDTQTYTLSVTKKPVTTIQQPREVEDVHFAKIRARSEVAQAGEVLEWRLELINDGTQDVEDLVVSALVYEFGDRHLVGPFDIQESETEQVTLVLDIPSWVEPGMYDVRFVAQDQGNIKVVDHRLIEIE